MNEVTTGLSWYFALFVRVVVGIVAGGIIIPLSLLPFVLQLVAMYHIFKRLFVKTTIDDLGSIASILMAIMMVAHIFFTMTYLHETPDSDWWTWRGLATVWAWALGQSVLTASTIGWACAIAGTIIVGLGRLLGKFFSPKKSAAVDEEQSVPLTESTKTPDGDEA